MNCRENDLAVVVNPGPHTGDVIHDMLGRALLGRMVVCKKLYFEDGAPAWAVDPFEVRVKVLQFTHGYVVARGSIVGILDSMLKPIRDPGDDAEDEMVSFLGKASGLPIYTSVAEVSR